MQTILLTKGKTLPHSWLMSFLKCSLFHKRPTLWILNLLKCLFYVVIVFGALLGTQEGRSMEILNSFELQYDIIDSDVIINTDYYHTKAEQCKQHLKLCLPKTRQCQPSLHM